MGSVGRQEMNTPQHSGIASAMTAVEIQGRRCSVVADACARFLILQPVDDHDQALLGSEVESIRSLTPVPFTLVAFYIRDWLNELTPWPSAPVFGKQGFGADAPATLSFVCNALLPALQQRNLYDPEKHRLVLGGYSLAGLFALWAGSQSDRFSGVVAASPSVWYPGWTDYASRHPLQASVAYLSLGNKEEQVRNPVMSRVGDCLRLQQKLLDEQGTASVLEWNEGGHFLHPDKRTARGFAWALNQLDRSGGHTKECKP